MDDKLKQFISESVSLDVIEQIVSSQEDWRKLKPARLGYALITLNAESPDNLSKKMDQACQIITLHGGMVDTITSNLIIATHGAIPNTEFDESIIPQICQTLQEGFGSRIRMVYHTTNGHHGKLGSDQSMRYTFTTPTFEHAMATLFSMEYGKIHEFEK